jgi:hypothetical protein
MYARAGERLTAANKLADKLAIISEIRDGLSDQARVPTLDQFTAAFETIRSSRVFTQQNRLVLYILRRLHASASKQLPDFGMMSVEHIAPQGARKPQDVSDAQVAQLGNLILIPRDLNGSLDDKDFPQKVPLMKAAVENGIHIPSDVLSSPQWGTVEIEKRTRILAKTAYEDVWSLQV